MFGGINQLLFALRMCPPQQKHQRGLRLADHLDYPVGEVLPALFGVRRCVGALYGHGGIEQQHPLIGP